MDENCDCYECEEEKRKAKEREEEEYNKRHCRHCFCKYDSHYGSNSVCCKCGSLDTDIVKKIDDEEEEREKARREPIRDNREPFWDDGNPSDSFSSHGW